MANTETVDVIQIDVAGKGESVAQLKQELKDLKTALDGAIIGSEEYNQTAKQLAAQQDLLKTVMYEQKEIAAETGRTYNSLSAEMGRLKVAQKNLDVSTEEGRAQFAAMAKTINGLNAELKALDAQNGVFSRNVGDYANQFGKAFKDVAKDMPSWTGPLKQNVDDVAKSFGLLATNPIVGVASLLLPVVTQITAGVKDNAQAADALRKILDALQPVFNLLNAALEKAVGWVADMLSKLGDLAGESTGTFRTIVTGAVGVGNALLQFLLTPIRTIIEAAKGLGSVFKDVFSGKFKEAAEDAKTALAGIGDAFTKGFSFKANFEAGQRVGEEFAAGMKSPKVKKAAQAAAKEVADAVAETLTSDDVQKALAAADKLADDQRRKRLDERKEVNEWFAAEDQALIDEINAMWEEERAAEDEATKAAEGNAKRRVEALQGAAGATSSILSSLADLYESNADASEKDTRKAKALRIAAATIDMLQGAVTAFSTAQQLGPIAGPIVGATNAAAVIAAGMANINKIRQTQVSANASTSGASISAPTPATVNAPAWDYTPPEQLRTVTSASEEDRLNRMAAPQKVYILQSDIEAAGHASKVRVDESTF